MGRGIATQFRDRFGRVDELHSQNKQVGQVAYLTLKVRANNSQSSSSNNSNDSNDSNASNGKKESNLIVFYLISKKFYYGKPSYQSLTDCLIEMKSIAQSSNIKTIAMPRIGCGLDLLDWNRVKAILEEILVSKDNGINVIVYTN